MPNAAMMLRGDPEIVQINRARINEGMAPLPTDEELNAMIATMKKVKQSQ